MAFYIERGLKQVSSYLRVELYTCFKLFGVSWQFGETRFQCPNFSKIIKFYHLNIWSFKFDIKNVLRQTVYLILTPLPHPILFYSTLFLSEKRVSLPNNLRKS